MAGGDKFAHVFRGQPFRMRADTYNGLCDAARKIQSFNPVLDRTGNRQEQKNTTLIRVENASGADRNCFSVLGIDDVTIQPHSEDDTVDEFLFNPTVVGITPTRASHRGRFVVLQEPLKSGEFGVGALLGLSVAYINITDTDHKWAEIKSGDTTQLKSAHHGSARIIWAESGTGTLKKALVLLGSSDDRQIVLGKTAASIAKGASGDVTVYEGDTKGSETTTGRTISVHNRFATSVASGKWVLCVWIGDGYELIAAECS